MAIFINRLTTHNNQTRGRHQQILVNTLSDLLKAWIRWLALGVCSLLWGMAHAQNPPMFCFPAATGPAFASGAPDWWTAGQQVHLPWDKPTDPRWLGALSRDYGYGATSQQEFRALTVDEPEPTAQNPNFRRTYLLLSWQFKLAPGWAASSNNPPRLFVGFSGASGENARLLKALVSTTNTGIGDDWLPVPVPGNQVSFYSNSTGTGQPASWSTSTPTWLQSKAKVHYWANTINSGSTSDRWVIQMKLPLDEAGVSGTGVNGLPIDRAGFKIWFSAVHPAFTLTGATSPTVAATYFTWPDDGSTTFAAVSQVDAPAQNITNWAPARADGNTAGCAGITLASGDIGTRRGGMDSNQVSVTQPNILFARPVLHAPSTAPASVPSNTLTATFRFANWGSQALGTYTGSSWTAPMSLNPNPPMDTTGMSADMGGMATTTIESTWNLTQAERCQFTGRSGVTDALGNFIPGNSACPNLIPIVDLHSCMQVELNGPGQLFLKQSAFRNMNFVQASEVVRGARISVAGLPNAAGGKRDVYMYVQQRNMPTYDSRLKSGSNDKSLIQVTPQQREILSTLARGGSPSGSVDALAGIMPTYLIHAFHDSGKDLIAEDGTKIRLLAPQTSFGYFVAHNGELQGWQDRLEGAQPVGPPNLYKVAVPNGGEVKVTNRISAVEPPCTCQCNDVSCRLKCNLTVANGGGTLSTSLAFVGALGAGGFAFLRRRRSQKLSDLVERSKD